MYSKLQSSSISPWMASSSQHCHQYWLLSLDVNGSQARIFVFHRSLTRNLKTEL